ncbi:MAG: hypothetical protein J6Y23_02375 [Prevotella sp.]|nr:hypothetical protein [Prevotella sp.]
MRRTVDFIACFIVLLSMVACYEDKGNYDYTELNEISVVSPAAGTYYAIDRYDTLHIEPKLAFTQSEMDDSQLDFLWEMYLDDWANTEAKAVVLSRDRNLDVMISRPASTTNYALVLTVTEKKTGAAYRTKYSVAIQPSVLSGLMVLQDDQGRCRLDYLASVYAEPSFTTNRHIKDVYAVNNDGTSLTGTPRGICYSLVEKSSYEPQVKNLYLWTDRQVARINTNDFSVEHLDNDLFMIAPEKIDVTCIERSRYSYSTIMINDGQAHALNQQATMSFGYQFSRQLKPNASIDGNLRFAPFVYEPDLFGSQTGYSAILYDEVGKRFVKVADGYDVEPALFAFNQQEEDNITSYFDVNHIGMDMLWMGKNYGSVVCAVFTDGTKRYLYRMRFNITSTTTDASSGEEVINPQVYRQAMGKDDFSAATDGNQAQFFECGRYAANTFMYATTRNIYTYDFNARRAILLNDPFPEGEEITAMRIYNVEYYTANLQNVSGTLLYVATWNGTEGKVYEFPINRTTLRFNNREDAEGNLKAPYHVFTGFGKVVDMCVKPQGRGDVAI